MQTRTISTSWEPGAATTDDSSGLESRLTWTPIAPEVEILAALDAPKQDSETLDAAFVRKEREIGAVLSRLTPTDSLALERRLALSLAGDPIAARFARLTAALRERLVSLISAMRHRHPSSVAREGARHG
jgi:hypothetical protein